MLKKVRYISSVTFLYGLTLLLLWQGINPSVPWDRNTSVVQAIVAPPVINLPKNESIIQPVVRSGTPARILIPSLGLDHEILPGIYNADTQTWNITDKGVHFAQPSNLPNDYSGSTLLYGHNSRIVFGRLYRMKQGEVVQIITTNNIRFTYSYVSSKDFDPHDTSAFNTTGPPTLLLQTCSGYFNEFRRFYSYGLQSVEQL